MAALLICGAIKAEEKQITSPDGKILVTISDKNGQPSYSVSSVSYTHLTLPTIA